MVQKIVVTGGSGRFGSILKKTKTRYKIFYPSSKELNILNLKKIDSYLKKKKPKTLIHLAGLSRPMKLHVENINKSIDLNIIGTSNIVKACNSNNVKLVYVSTNYVYPGVKGNYSEQDCLLPTNNYAWSKLGGEAAVHLFKNSLILRVCMTEKPFVHKEAFSNVKTSFAYHEDVAKIIFKILNYKGIINIGGKSQYIYDFAKKDNRYVKKKYLKRSDKSEIPLDSSISILKLKKILKNKWKIWKFFV